MAKFEPLTGLRDLDVVPDDYRPKKWRPRRIEPDNAEYSFEEDEGFDEYPEVDNVERTAVNEVRTAGDFPSPKNSAALELRGRDEEPHRCRLDEIANILRTLTFGEMLEIAESLWSVNPAGSRLTESGLPAVLHRWSKSRQP